MARWWLFGVDQVDGVPAVHGGGAGTGLHEAFRPAAGQIAWAREQTRTPEHRLALVVLLDA
jgi:hypothetical protein